MQVFRMIREHPVDTILVAMLTPGIVGMWVLSMSAIVKNITEMLGYA